jgi:hypothetical protein
VNAWGDPCGAHRMGGERSDAVSFPLLRVLKKMSITIVLMKLSRGHEIIRGFHYNS